MVSKAKKKKRERPYLLVEVGGSPVNVDRWQVVPHVSPRAGTTPKLPSIYCHMQNLDIQRNHFDYEQCATSSGSGNGKRKTMLTY